MKRIQRKRGGAETLGSGRPGRQGLPGRAWRGTFEGNKNKKTKTKWHWNPSSPALAARVSAFRLRAQALRGAVGAGRSGADVADQLRALFQRLALWLSRPINMGDDSSSDDELLLKRKPLPREARAVASLSTATKSTTRRLNFPPGKEGGDLFALGSHLSPPLPASFPPFSFLFLP